MVERKLAGALGALTVAGVVALGAYGFVNGSVLDVSGDARPAATYAAFAVAVLFVAGLTAIGTNAGRWLRTPYW